MGCLRFPWVCVPLSGKPAAARSRLLPAQPHMLPSYSPGQLHGSPSRGAPPHTEQHHPHPGFFAERRKRVQSPSPARSSTASSAQHLRPPSTAALPSSCWGWGRSQGSAEARPAPCTPQQPHHPVRTPPCAPGEAKLSTPPRSWVTTSRHLSNSQTAVHKGLGWLRQPRGGLSPPFQQRGLAWECLGRGPLCFWEASSLSRRWASKHTDAANH